MKVQFARELDFIFFSELRKRRQKWIERMRARERERPCTRKSNNKWEMNSNLDAHTQFVCFFFAFNWYSQNSISSFQTHHRRRHYFSLNLWFHSHLQLNSHYSISVVFPNKKQDLNKWNGEREKERENDGKMCCAKNGMFFILDFFASCFTVYYCFCTIR